eukprot:NODE_10251_length_292_cov_8.728395_g8483_i0.p3 GENE.NODE_10251_length_292_cov_8.728395_g8483_i0~~NODE_10251_length_292_cov_8.728395_g8483_i0.p3  ORF type:complete len:50 (+),score=2.39 NODE_10251_length_292_cov_8.728395_g8483_i0:140-289(+)
MGVQLQHAACRMGFKRNLVGHGGAAPASAYRMGFMRNVVGHGGVAPAAA